jgi:hypothetical protein
MYLQPLPQASRLPTFWLPLASDLPSPSQPHRRRLISMLFSPGWRTLLKKSRNRWYLSRRSNLNMLSRPIHLNNHLLLSRLRAHLQPIHWRPLLHCSILDSLIRLRSINRLQLRLPLQPQRRLQFPKLPQPRRIQFSLPTRNCKSSFSKLSFRVAASFLQSSLLKSWPLWAWVASNNLRQGLVSPLHQPLSNRALPQRMDMEIHGPLNTVGTVMTTRVGVRMEMVSGTGAALQTSVVAAVDLRPIAVIVLHMVRTILLWAVVAMRRAVVGRVVEPATNTANDPLRDHGEPVPVHLPIILLLNGLTTILTCLLTTSEV